MKPKPLQSLLLIFCAALPAAARLNADTVVLDGKPPFRNVRVTGFAGGRLVFRGASGELLRKPLRDVVRLKIDRYPMLSNAEALRLNAPDVAVSAYRQALGELSEAWLRDLVRVRLMEACDRAGRFGDAVCLYIELACEHRVPLDDLAPCRPADPGAAENRTALDRLRAALAPGAPAAGSASLRSLALGLLLFEEVDPLPPGFEPPPATGQSQPARPATSASAPADEPPLLFGPDSHAGAPAPSAATGPPPRLPADSFVLARARQALADGDAPRAVRLLERALPYVPDAAQAPWRLVLGRARIECGDYARAAEELLALAASATGPDLAAEALYYVGVAHERMDRADVAAGIYHELLQRQTLPDELRRLAGEGLQRIGD